MTLPNIALFLLGGTITMDNDPDQGAGVVPTVDAAGLCRAVPGLDRVARVTAHTDSMIASGNLTFSHAFDLARRITAAAEAGAADGFVVIQGTDTLEEMAFLLDCLLDIPEPVVVTGAMRSPAQPGADGPANILAAVTCAATPDVGTLGAVVVMNDELHSARHVTKGHTGSLAAFHSPDTGPLGRLVEGRLRLFARPATTGVTISLPAAPAVPPVPLIKVSYDDGGYLLGLVAAADCAGLVIEGFGAGHLPENYFGLLDRLVPRIPVILSSRSGAGHVFRGTYGYPGAEIDLIRRGVIPSGILPGLKARLLLTLLLLSGAPREDIRAAFDIFDL